MTDPDARLRSVPSATLRTCLEGEGVHVVHVWAPWCDNSLRELRPVWADHARLGADSVTFVTVWNDGESGADVLEAHGVTVDEVVVPGPKPEKAGRRTTLLGLPVTWIPTTWVFNRGGLLATAFNYGEVTASKLADAVQGARSGW